MIRLTAQKRETRRQTWSVVVSLFVLVGVLVLCSSVALAAVKHPYVSQLTGTPSGPFSEGVCGVTVDPKSQDIFVVDPGHNAIDIFNSAGAYKSEISGLSLPEGTTFEEYSCSVALNDTTGDVFVAGPGVVYVFNSLGGYVSTMTGANTPGKSFGGGFVHVAVDEASGDLYVSDSTDGVVDRFNSEGVYKSQVENVGEAGPLAVDSQGDIYVASKASFVDEFNSSGGRVGQFNGTPSGPFGNVTGIAVDGEHDVYISDSGVERHAVDEFASSGAFLSQTTGSDTPHRSLSEPAGVAANAVGDVYVADRTRYAAPGNASVVDVFGPAVTLPDVSTGQASGLTATAATLSGEVNPNGVPVTSCFLEYGVSSSYGHSVSCASNPGEGTEPVPVTASVTGLQQLTVYHYRLVAGNANSPELQRGEDRTFETYGHPMIDGESAAAVASGNATFQAQIDPHGYDTTYHFEYGPSTLYGTSVPVPDADIGAGTSDVAVTAYVQNLQPGTRYHFRVVASNSLGTVEGSDKTFTTQPTGGAFTLPDGRGWEMVSPPSKEGAMIEAISYEGGVIQASADGSAITYLASGPIEAEPAGSRSAEWTQVLAPRGAAGWASKDIATPHNAATGLTIGNISEYKLFSNDLSLGLVEPTGDTPLSPEASEKTIYLRNDASGSYTPLVTAGNVPAGTKFGGSPGEENSEIHLLGGTPDLKAIVLQSSDALTTNAIKNGTQGSLYEWAGGRLQLVSVLPTGKPATAEGEGEAAFLGYQNRSVRHAISNDGSRVVWEAGTHLYMWSAVSGTSIQLDEAQGAPNPGEGKAVFQTANSEGSEVLFTDEKRLTADSTASGSPSEQKRDLYGFDVKTGKLTALTAGVKSPGESADVQGTVTGASEDGSYVYFVANGVLAPGANPGNCVKETSASRPPGAVCNLYVAHNGMVTFIATLSNEDGNDWEETSFRLGSLTSRASPNGRFFAFMSEQSLTGYDNHDANSGAPDEEVFLYDAETKRLVCASCNPSGARPVGILGQHDFPGLIVDRPRNWPSRWLAGSIPGWTGPESQRAFYQSRYLSDEGRLFFNSSDALDPQDTNGKEDVYQYEPSNSAAKAPPNDGCTTGSTSYSSASGGCLGLISSGTSSAESTFLDASENGNDVFFLTAARLVPQDQDTAFDIYDAHVCSPTSPCLPAAPAPPAACAADVCQGPLAAAPGLSSAGSIAQAPGENVPAASPKTVAKSKPLTRARKLAKALKACARQAKKKRAVCRAAAKKRYGPPRAKKTLRSGTRSRREH